MTFDFLSGSTDEEAAFMDGMTEHQRDIQDAYRKAKTDGKVDEYFSEALPKSLGLVEKIVAGKSGPFMLGDKPTIVDVVFYCFLCEFLDDKDKAKAAYETCPKIKAAMEAFGALDSVKTWQETRPKTMF